MPPKLPLEDLWKSRGAHFREESGWLVPASFGSPENEYRAAKETSAFFDLSWRGKLAVSGNDRISLLHNLLTNDILSLQNGGGCYAAFLTAQGKIIADMKVYIFEDHIFFDTEPGLPEKIADRLGRFIITEDVLMKKASDVCHFLVTGPGAAHLLKEVFGNLPDFSFAHRGGQIAGRALTVVKSGLPGLDGYEIFVKEQDARYVAEELLKTMPAAGHETWESLRVEAGWLRYGQDMTEADTLPETGLDAIAASETKGCYPGQEVVARTNTYKGHAKKMTALSVDPGWKAEAGDKLKFEGEEAGWITSAAYAGRRCIMLGYLKKAYFDKGEALRIVSGKDGASASVSLHTISLTPP